MHPPSCPGSWSWFSWIRERKRYMWNQKTRWILDQRNRGYRHHVGNFFIWKKNETEDRQIFFFKFTLFLYGFLWVKAERDKKTILRATKYKKYKKIFLNAKNATILKQNMLRLALVYPKLLLVRWVQPYNCVHEKIIHRNKYRELLYSKVVMIFFRFLHLILG